MCNEIDKKIISQLNSILEFQNSNGYMIDTMLLVLADLINARIYINKYVDFIK